MKYIYLERLHLPVLVRQDSESVSKGFSSRSFKNKTLKQVALLLLKSDNGHVVLIFVLKSSAVLAVLKI